MLGPNPPPDMPAALCATTSTDLWNGDADDREIGERLCRRCPELDRCKQWVATIPRINRHGVIGGIDWTGRPGRRRTGEAS